MWVEFFVFFFKIFFIERERACAGRRGRGRGRSRLPAEQGAQPGAQSQDPGP